MKTARKRRWGYVRVEIFFFRDFFLSIFSSFIFFSLCDRRESNFRIDSPLFYLFGFCRLHPVVSYLGGFIRKKCVNPLIAKLKWNDNDFVVNEFGGYL